MVSHRVPSAPLRFRSRIEINGINPYVLIDPRQALQLKRNWRRPMPVRVQINGQPEVPWRINLMPRGDGSFYLYLAGIVRKASGTGVGDVVNVSVEFDAEYQAGPVHPMPRWFGARLNSNPLARTGWRRLPPSRQKEILRYPGHRVLAGFRADCSDARDNRGVYEKRSCRAYRLIQSAGVGRDVPAPEERRISEQSAFAGADLAADRVACASTVRDSAQAPHRECFPS
jgi:hypothetical protein